MWPLYVLVPTPALPYRPAMANDQTFGDLYKAKAILKADLDAAVKAYMTDPAVDRFAIGDGYTADLAAAVVGSPFAAGMIADPGIKPGSKRSAVRTTILVARPVR